MSDTTIARGIWHGKLLDLTGKIYGRLHVLQEVQSERRPNGSYQRFWECRCDCGKITIVRQEHLRSGTSKSCGCYKDDMNGRHSLKHGHYSKREQGSSYMIWYNMKRRCQNPNDHAYRHYGGRGIICCPAWSASYKLFVTDMGPRPVGYTLDRIDNDGPYCPFNCQWATYTTQANNRRNNHRLTMDGRTLTVAKWCAELGLSHGAVRARILGAGWAADRAMKEPIRRGTHNYRLLTYDGRMQCLHDWALETGLGDRTIAGRLKKGWSVDKALTTPIQVAGGRWTTPH